MARWMINCREHSRLTSKSMDHPLTFWERLRIRLHQWLCPPCAGVKKQLRAIRDACRHTPSDSDTEQRPDKHLPRLPEDACRRIKAAIREQSKKLDAK